MDSSTSLRRDEHEVGQLVNDDHDARQLLERFVRCGKGVIARKVLDVVLGEELVALHHLVDRPLQGARRLLRVGDDRNEQVRDAVVGRKLDHLRVDHDEAHLVRRGLIKERNDERIGADGFAGAGRAGDEDMRELGNVADDVVARNVLADGKGDTRFVLCKLAGLQHVADVDGGDELVRHLDADDGDLIEGWARCARPTRRAQGRCRRQGS